MSRMLLCTLLTGALLVPGAQAAPRVGSHDGFTRVVFDLPASAKSSVKVQGQSITVQLNVSLKAEQGPLNASGVTAYAVAGKTVTVTLARGHTQAKASVLPASGSQNARLVIDVPTSAAASKVPATPNSQGTRTPVAVARPASTAPAPAAKPAVRPRVVLDAGHGGKDPGAQSPWTSEEEVTLDIALRTRAELVKHGVDVVMVRESDRHLSVNKSQDLEARSRLAKNGTVSAFVSIHVNAAGPGAQGIETFYFGQPMAGRNRSLAVQENGGGTVGEALTRQASTSAQNMLGDILAQAKIAFSRDLAHKVQSRLIAATGAVNRGVQTDAFYVISNPTTPAILVEVGFGSSPVEGPKLAQAAYRERISQALARAILDFLNTK
ncbi:putative N-acetylmuramoyl-L-alanine amidase, precursor [Deinococcus deserti VCD115]|uniref:Putative N-acetylmuramoyl-L-alanine amidase n=1 Tax=Deinococcus deserti (strain DSM 17065 / CIP 109153 / LMG 22923 / VCD115) TaxID=546414 RepID=C1CWV3_DEIDV|nr:putative N-acetylmuramoyl-L-alanine amidase, precursor [Deinococcus deserti VCD115]